MKVPEFVDRALNAIIAVAVLLGVVGVVACVIPARRATTAGVSDMLRVE